MFPLRSNAVSTDGEEEKGVSLSFHATTVSMQVYKVYCVPTVNVARLADLNQLLRRIMRFAFCYCTECYW